MTQPGELYERTMKMLKPALERVASDAEFRNRLEMDPLAALAEMNVALDPETRREMEGKRFSEFWALRRRAVEGPVGLRDLPPEEGALSDSDLSKVAGGFGAAPRLSLRPERISLDSFAPPYVPVGPVGGDQ